MIRFGEKAARVQLSAQPSCSNSYLFQRWSTTWNAYIDEEETADLEDKYHVTVVQMPLSGESPQLSKVKSNRIGVGG
jgi:hypothetical protein